MIHSPRFSVILDACVLYPAPIRDLLLSFAAEGLYKPKWTDAINDEWIRNLLENRPDLSEDRLRLTVEAMNLAFPDALIDNYEDLIPSLELPDEEDRHVLACGIRANADLITTFNLKDFPESEVGKYDIEVQHPDMFIVNLLDLNPEKGCEAFSKMVNRLKNPLLSKEEVLEALRKCGLKESLVLLKKKCV